MARPCHNDLVISCAGRQNTDRCLVASLRAGTHHHLIWAGRFDNFLIFVFFSCVVRYRGRYLSESCASGAPGWRGVSGTGQLGKAVAGQLFGGKPLTKLALHLVGWAAIRRRVWFLRPPPLPWPIMRRAAPPIEQVVCGGGAPVWQSAEEEKLFSPRAEKFTAAADSTARCT